MSNFKRNCPKCQIELCYKTKFALDRAIKSNSSCKYCGKSISEEKIQQILLLNEKGLSNREISRRLKINRAVLKKYLRKNNRSNNWCNIEPEMVSDTDAKCKICKNIFPISEFKRIFVGVTFSYDICKNNKCKATSLYLKERKYIEEKSFQDPTYLLKIKYNTLKAQCKIKKILFDISRIDFINQFLSQNNKCFYTDEMMILEYKEKAKSKTNGADRNSVSIDKIIPSKGYTLGNVVFCCNKINVVKNDLSLDEIKKYLHPSFIERINIFFKQDT